MVAWVLRWIAMWLIVKVARRVLGMDGREDDRGRRRPARRAPWRSA
jgi:hypothetical protein